MWQSRKMSGLFLLFPLVMVLLSFSILQARGQVDPHISGGNPTPTGAPVSAIATPDAASGTLVVRNIENGGLEASTAFLDDEGIDALGGVLDRIAIALQPKEIGLYASRFDANGNLMYRVRYNDNEPHAIASTFKAFAAFYYFMNTPEDEWEYQFAENVYSMVVYSNNTKTGNLLAEVATRIPGPGNPIEKFNDFLHNYLGVSRTSGIFSWDHGTMEGFLYTDETYAPLPYNENGYVQSYDRRIPIGNRFTAADAARATEFIARAIVAPDTEPLVRKAAENTRLLMTINDPLYPTTFDKIAWNLGTWRKYGYLGPNEIGTAALTETIVVPLYDGGFMTIAALSTGERGRSYPNELTYIFGELINFDHERLLQILPDKTFPGIPTQEPVPDAYNYGFVKPYQIRLYSAPAEGAETIPNVFRQDFALPTARIYAGTLVRFTPVDDTWGRLAWHNNEPPYNGVDAYVRLDDLHIVDYSLFEPITLTETDSGDPVEKYVVLDKPNSTFTLFEDGTPVLKSPALMNIRWTPDGSTYVATRFATLDRYEFPFAGLVSMFGPLGESFVSSPFEWWEETVREGFETQRYTIGSVHVPTWEVDIPGYGTERVDVFLFRWLGGLSNPGDDSLIRARDEIIRVYSFRYEPDDLRDYAVPFRAASRGVTWDTILAGMADAPLTVPDYYYESDFSDAERRMPTRAG